MKEPYRKGLATHPDPESCAGGGNIAGEALTGAHAGQPSSSEITSIGVPTLCLCGEGNMSSDGTREPLQDAAESKTLRMRGNSLHGNRETPRPPPPMLAEDGPRRLLPYVGHVRPRGVGRSHSTEEAGEQSRPDGGGGGVRGGKGIDQGKRHSNLTRAGLRAGKARHRFVGRTTSDGAETPRGRRTSLPKVRAV